MTSLSVGGEKCSKLARELEADKHAAEEFIKSHHAEAMTLYDKLVDEGNRYLREGTADVSG